MACVAPCGVTWRRVVCPGAVVFQRSPRQELGSLPGVQQRTPSSAATRGGTLPPRGEDLGSIPRDFGTAFPEASSSRGAVPSMLCFPGVGDRGVPTRGQAVGCLCWVTGGAEPAEQGYWQSCCGQGPHTQTQLGCISLNSILNKINLN